MTVKNLSSRSSETEISINSVRFIACDKSSADAPLGHTASPRPPSRMDPTRSPRARIQPPPSPRTSIQSLKPESPNRTASKNTFHSANLRSNLTREQRNRDPLFFYEIVQTLGVGSMGTVAQVRKRKDFVGGSARKVIQEAVQRQKRNEKCLNIPFIGGLFRSCVHSDLTHRDNSSKCLGNSVVNPISQWFGYTSNSLNDSGNDESTILLSQSRNQSVGSLDSSGHGSEIISTGATIDYAMKSIHLNRVTDKTFLTELRNEVAILKQLDHPHIVRAIETFEHRNQIFMVMELCSGGDLYSRDPYTEEQAARIITSILSAVGYMHSKNILHRDLKYENVLFVNNSPQAEVKLIDFGLSKVYFDKVELTEGVGTIYTMAPEVLRGTYNSKADIWSVGVIAYMLLSSQMPFYGRKRQDIVEQILDGQYDFRGRRWKRISAQAKAFVEDLLVLDVDERADVQTAMSATWLNRRFAATARGPDAKEERMARHAMLRYAGYTKLKKMALMVVAHKSSSEEIGVLRKLFQKYDKKRDGSIGYEDFCSALAESGHSDMDLREMFDAVDLDGKGQIRYTEFLAATIEARGAISEERLAEAFDRLDSDDSGFISAENLIEMLGPDFPRHEIDEILQEATLNNHNQVSYSEFLQLWEEKHEQERSHQLDILGVQVVTSSISETVFSSFQERSFLESRLEFVSTESEDY